MPEFIKLTRVNGDIWVNGGKILYMVHADGETAVFFEGSSVAIYVKEQPMEIRRMIEKEREA